MKKKNVVWVNGDAEKNILELLKEKNEYLNAPCNGSGNCGKCRVRLLEGVSEPTAREKNLLTKEELAEGIRLACQTIPKQECRLQILNRQHSECDSEDQILNAVSLSVQKKAVVESEAVLEKKTVTGHKLSGQEYGIAIDIGTTTIAAALIELTTGENVAVQTAINHQRAYGADVISRIKASVEGNGKQLQQLIQKDLKEIISGLLEHGRAAKQQVKRVVIAGNTTMCHLLSGYPCDTLGKAPFCPVDISLQRKTCREVLGTEELMADIFLLPGISAFVGADIVAGIMACGMLEREDYTLFLDIGTNGEMAVGNRDGLFVTSTAAGPAFEGGNISCGIASVAGAIDKVEINYPYTKVHTLGEKSAIGICGTGLIETIYELLRNRIMDEHGTLGADFIEEGYPLVKNQIFLKQQDIREFQVAKAAVRAGIERLLEWSGVCGKDIARVCLAGSFGCHIPVEKAIGTGLLPEELKEKILPEGNTALEGAKQFLLYQDSEKLERIIALTKEIKLATDTEFQDKFLQYMDFENGRNYLK